MEPKSIPTEIVQALAVVLRFIQGSTGQQNGKATEPDKGDIYYSTDNNPLGRRAFRRAAARGDFPAFRVGRKLLARKTDVDAWIQSQPPAPRKSRTRKETAPRSLTPAEIHAAIMRSST
jgi:hypothetical protein